MLTIGQIPRKIKRFFQPARAGLSSPAFAHLCFLVLAMTTSQAGSTVERLTRLLRNSTHRTKHGEFLWKSNFDHLGVVQAIALDTLRRLTRKHAGKCYFIIDETQTLKRAKKMAGVGKLFHHASGKYATGHTMLKVCLWYRGVTIPWGTWLYLKQEHAAKSKLPFAKLTELAALAIFDAQLPKELEVTVLFDCYYLCPVVTDACRRKHWHYVGVGKGNRNFTVGGRRVRLDRYGRNVLARSGRWQKIQGLSRSGWYQVAERVGFIKKLGEVKVVFSRRRGERKVFALVTDDLGAPPRQVVGDYLKRWAVELWIKEEKQHLGMGDYRVLRLPAVARHLALVDIAYACLTHLALSEPGAQGHKKNKLLLHLPSIDQLKARMRQEVWRETVQDIVKHSHEKPVLRRLEQLLAA